MSVKIALNPLAHDLVLVSTDMLGVFYDGFIHDLKWTIIIV